MAPKQIHRTLLASALLLVFGVPADAAPITTIFNTGVDALRVSRPDNALELHYTLIAPSPVTGTPFVARASGGFPIPPWLGDSPISAWIAPSTNTLAASGVFTYHTTFDLTGLNPATALLRGRWSSDNNGLNILINGVSTGQTTAFDSFVRWSPFEVTSNFTSGINSLDFVINNGAGGANPTGLRVEFTVAQADPIVVSAVPEPASMALVVAGLAGLGFARRCKSS